MVTVMIPIEMNPGTGLLTGGVLCILANSIRRAALVVCRMTPFGDKSLSRLFAEVSPR